MKLKSLRRTGIALLFPVAILAALLGNACGGGGSKSATSTPTTPTPGASAAAASPTPNNATAKAGNIDLWNIRARTTVTDTTAVYFTMKNSGPDDTLLSAAVDPSIGGPAQVHVTVTSGGTMQMQEMKAGLPIPANATIELRPGSYHIMVMNLKKPIANGDVLPVTLVFEKGGTVTIKAVAQDIDTGAGSGGGTAGGMAPATPVMGR